MINFKQLDHIQLCIPIGKEDEARKFYGEILGLREIPKPESLIKNGGVWFELVGIGLHIGVEEINPTISKRHPAFEVENIKAVRDYLISKQVKIKEDTPITNIERFSIFDPWGNRIELLERIESVSDEVKQFWHDFILRNPEYKNYCIPKVDHFCNDKINTDLCAELVKKGIKKASCGLKLFYEMDKDFFPKVNQLSIIVNWDKEPICVVKTNKIYFQKFKDIDAEWAKSEGEGDQTLEQWRETHKQYFQNQLTEMGLVFTEEVELICEKFALID